MVKNVIQNVWLTNSKWDKENYFNTLSYLIALKNENKTIFYHGVVIFGMIYFLLHLNKWKCKYPRQAVTNRVPFMQMGF